LDRSKCASAAGLARDGYVLADPADGDPDLLLMASGSEVSLCLTAVEPLAAEDIRARVVSMPSWELSRSKPRSTGIRYSRLRRRPGSRSNRPRRWDGRMPASPGRSSA
jgi:transketolase